MTNRGAISNVRTDLKRTSADIRLTDWEIYIILNKHSKWLIERESNGFKLLRKWDLYQSLNCVDVIDVPLIDECCNITTKCTIKRTRDKLPSLYEDSMGPLIRTVTSVDDTTHISISTFLEYPKRKDNPWSDNTGAYYFYKNGYLYGDLPKKINIFGIYADDISHLSSCAKKDVSCSRFLDRKWMVPSILEAQIIDYTVKELAPSLSIPSQEKIDKNENHP